MVTLLMPHVFSTHCIAALNDDPLPVTIVLMDPDRHNISSYIQSAMVRAFSSLKARPSTQETTASLPCIIYLHHETQVSCALCWHALLQTIPEFLSALDGF